MRLAPAQVAPHVTMMSRALVDLAARMAAGEAAGREAAADAAEEEEEEEEEERLRAAAAARSHAIEPSMHPLNQPARYLRLARAAALPRAFAARLAAGAEPRVEQRAVRAAIERTMIEARKALS